MWSTTPRQYTHARGLTCEAEVQGANLCVAQCPGRPSRGAGSAAGWANAASMGDLLGGMRGCTCARNAHSRAHDCLSIVSAGHLAVLGLIRLPSVIPAHGSMWALKHV